MGHIMVRLMCAGSMFVGLGTKVRGRELREGGGGREGGREGVEKARKRYLPGSHCLQASPGWVCSSVTQRQREAKGRMNDRDRVKERKNTRCPPQPRHSLKKNPKKNQTKTESLSQIEGEANMA